MLVLDGCGALLTASLMAALIGPRSSFFGLPQSISYSLASAGCLLASYSFVCAACYLEDRRPWLRAVAIANLCYCGVTLSLFAVLDADLTLWGQVYLAVEIAVVGSLSLFELSVARGTLP